MNFNLRQWLLVVSLGALVLTPSNFRAEGDQRATAPLKIETLPKLQALIKPQPGEAKWLDIPWEIDVFEARKKAATLGKPIFFLTGGGLSPLGEC